MSLKDFLDLLGKLAQNGSWSCADPGYDDGPADETAAMGQKALEMAALNVGIAHLLAHHNTNFLGVELALAAAHPAPVRLGESCDGSLTALLWEKAYWLTLFAPARDQGFRRLCDLLTERTQATPAGSTPEDFGDQLLDLLPDLWRDAEIRATASGVDTANLAKLVDNKLAGFDAEAVGIVLQQEYARATTHAARTPGVPAGPPPEPEPMPNPVQAEQLPPGASLQSRAIALLLDHPSWTNTQLARALGCNPKSLSRTGGYAKLKAARAALRQGRRDIAQGFLDGDGRVEGIG
jgi:hypothetical protein